MSDSSEYALTKELSELEQQLAELRPCEITEGLMARLEKSIDAPCAKDIPREEGLSELEKHLEVMAPASMPDNILERMTLAMERWHEHVPEEEKVVPFTKKKDATPAQTPARKRIGGGMLAAAAAVAMLGALTALVMPRFFDSAHSQQGEVAAHEEADLDVGVEPSPAGGSQAVWLSSDSLSHKVTNTSDRGVVMTRDNTPHRCIRVDYEDRILLQDEQGREVIIKRPRVDFMLIPAETN